MANRQPTRKESEATTRSMVSEDEIRRRAYEIYLERGGRPGSALDDWLKAKAELELAHLLPIGGSAL